MKISTRGVYAIRALIDIAQNQKEAPVALRSIAQRQNLSESYLEQLFTSLKKAGLVKSLRGAQGGYELTKLPEDLKVIEIIRVMEGPIAPVECVNEESTDSGCDNASFCTLKPLWSRLRDSMITVLEATSLADLLTEVDPKK